MNSIYFEDSNLVVGLLSSKFTIATSLFPI